jgi:hypothetical protein
VITLGVDLSGAPVAKHSKRERLLAHLTGLLAAHFLGQKLRPFLGDFVFHYLAGQVETQLFHHRLPHTLTFIVQAARDVGGQNHIRQLV